MIDTTGETMGSTRGGEPPLNRKLSETAQFLKAVVDELPESNLPSLIGTLAEAKAGIEKRVHPHGLRHTHAAELAREGTPLNLIQAQLGHESLATTDKYLRHIAPEELVKAMKARIWKPPED